MTHVERAARRTLHSLRTRNFRLYFLGQIVSGTVMEIEQFPIIGRNVGKEVK